MKYSEDAKIIWQKYVPDKGQADTVHGELLRAIEKLRNEAQDNGNMNWDAGFEILRTFIGDILGQSDAHSFIAKRKLIRDIAHLADYEHPYVDDDLYDRLADALVEWSRKHPEPLTHKHNPALQR